MTTIVVATKDGFKENPFDIETLESNVIAELMYKDVKM
jgi:hypothetical protein